MNHDRVHAKAPSHHVDRWSVGEIESVGERNGHCVVTVRPVADGEAADRATEGGGDAVELVITLAVRDLFVSRLSIEADESPVGERVWYRKRGG